MLTLIVVWLLLHRQCSAAIGPNGPAVYSVCEPRPLGGDGVVFANAAHYYIFILITQ